MARNEEKSMATLNRWQRMKEEEEKKEKGIWVPPEARKRPFLASMVHTVGEGEKWRNQVLGEIRKKVAAIQNPGLGEGPLRELNDSINKLFREKKHWERRIVDLGGPNYAEAELTLTGIDGGEISHGGGYKYFGAAKELPGVRELFAKKAAKAVKKTRTELFKGVDADYYGLRDDEDGVLEGEEAVAGEAALAEAQAAWLESQGGENDDDDDDASKGKGKGKGKEPADAPRAKRARVFMAHVPSVPSMADMEAAVMEKRKAAIRKQFSV